MRKVLLTNTASSQLTSILEYLQLTRSTKVRKEFISRLDTCIELVKTNPHLFPRSFIKTGVHKCVVSIRLHFIIRIIRNQ